MKQTDLRIGNYIRYRDEWDCEIQSLGGSFETHNKDLNDRLHGIRCGSDDIEDYNPITVTGDWLVKLGFRGRNDFKWLNNVGLQIIDNKFFGSFKDLSNVVFHSVIEIKYVHQLQNLYFALTGKELELKPCN